MLKAIALTAQHLTSKNVNGRFAILTQKTLKMTKNAFAIRQSLKDYGEVACLIVVKKVEKKVIKL